MPKKPSDIRYSSTHIWVRLSETGDEATMGVTDYFLRNWDDISSIDLPKRGGKVEQGSPFGEIESEDSSATIISPLSGKVRAINKDVIKKPSILLEDPYDDGWLIQIRLGDLSEAGSLMSRSEYEDLLESDVEETGGKELFGEEDEEL